MPGFEIKRFVRLNESLATHLKCGICLNIYKEPVETKCGHIFCTDCIQMWTKKNENMTCPECRESLITDDEDIGISEPIFERNLKLNNIMNELNIICCSNGNGCQDVIKLGSLSSHLEKCDQILCKTCGLKMGIKSEHNCFELMRTQHELKPKMCKFAEGLQKLLGKLRRNESFTPKAT